MWWLFKINRHPEAPPVAPVAPPVDQGTDENPEWMDVFPDEVKTDPDMKKYKTAEDFYKSYKNQNEAVGRKGVLLPKEGADPKEWDKVWNTLGRPEKPEGYKFSEVKDVHPSIVNAGDISNQLKGVFHGYGLSQGTADKINADFISMLSNAAKHQEQKQADAIKATEAELRKDWGENFDKNRSLVGKAAKQILGEDGVKALGGEQGIGNNPYFNKLIHALASQLSEDTLARIPGQPQTGPAGGEMTKEQAKKDLADMQDPATDIYKALFDERHKDHDAIVERRQKAYKVLYGSGAS